jgi:hypothetical protein
MAQPTRKSVDDPDIRNLFFAIFIFQELFYRQ